MKKILMSCKKKYSKTCKNCGYTITELLVVVAIIGVLFSLGPRIFQQVNRFIFLNKTKLELQKDARTTLSLINRNLRQASASTIVIDSLPGQFHYSRISFTRIDGMWFKFYQQGNNLFMQTSNSQKILTSNLRYLAFSPPRTEDLSIISVSLTLEKGTYETRTKALHMASEKVMVMN